MNKKGVQMNTALKILFAVFGILTIFSGINELLISTGRESLVRLVTSNVAFSMQILYAIMGLSSLVTSAFLGIKLFKK
jgi:hypothetical protein